MTSHANLGRQTACSGFPQGMRDINQYHVDWGRFGLALWWCRCPPWVLLGRLAPRAPALLAFFSGRLGRSGLLTRIQDL